MIRLLIIIALLSGFPAVSYAVEGSQSTDVRIRTIAFGDESKGIRSKIYRKVLVGNGDYLLTTDDQGNLLWHEPECAKGAMYKAIPVNNFSFLSDENWQQCTPDKEIVFQFIAAGISNFGYDILNGDLDASIPLEYRDASKTISVLAKAENWGAAAKLASQISAQLRAAGKIEQANAFGEISMYTTIRGAYLAMDAPVDKLSTVFDGTTASVDSLPRYSAEAKDVLFHYQGHCGVVQSGRADWDTMSCLPGGSDFKLPTDVLKLPRF